MMNGSMQVLPEYADYAYICQSRLLPMTDAYGDHDYLIVTFATPPQCMGSFVGSGYMFSDGVTHPQSDDRYLASENQLLTFFELASRAADTGQRVRYYRCADDKTLCLKHMAFRGDPADVAAD